MTLRLVALRALAAVTLALAGLAGASAAPASADPGACTPSSGVVVVVDLRPFGGGIERGCDPSPTTGFTALHTAGFPTVGTQHDGPGFICRIKGQPTAAADPCVVTPPASRYWSYWHSDAGQSGWSYSQLGATSYRPKPGSVDAWVYGATDLGGTTGGPGFSSGSVRAVAPVVAQPTPSPTSSTGGGTGSSGGTGSGGGASGGGAASGATSGGTGGGAAGGGGAGGTTAGAPGTRPTGSAGSASSSGSADSAGSSGKAGSAGSTTSPAQPPPSSATASGAGPASPPATTAATSDPVPSTPIPSTSDTASAAAGTPGPGTSSDPPVVDVRAAPAAQTATSETPWPTLLTLAALAVLGGLAVLLARRRRQSDA